jgi:hypothetical protein
MVAKKCRVFKAETPRRNKVTILGACAVKFIVVFFVDGESMCGVRQDVESLGV